MNNHLGKFKYILAIFALSILTIDTYQSNHHPISQKQPTKWKATVMHIIDGDTLEIELHGKRKRVRLLLVDTPELNKQNEKKSQPFAEKAKAFLQAQLAGQTLFFEQDEKEKDDYDRLLLYAFKGDQLIQELLLMNGYARIAPFPPNLKYYERLKAVEEKAKRQKVVFGLSMDMSQPMVLITQFRPMQILKENNHSKRVKIRTVLILEHRKKPKLILKLKEAVHPITQTN
ncbi:Endonuclease YncB, thermonuclease family [Thermoflavimicrobium dichotomicum]|uniref:Endonuclease YncB, thermonuclease family n=1 Tax=Thermoflavimicrobium dichotomicum TaxID=46223 RepID=A0A1I3MW19_9BACL|nr:thermonuclease family protein [Thermoflavimicrobium dichotomicum]SFJ00856.1 Endonuclease YncB, thermonuclease family [Thermoflavimicrobium dichotomicum]